MRRKLAIGALILLLLLAVAAAVGDRVLLRAMRAQVVSTLSGEDFAQYADGLNIVLCGAGSPMPDPARAGPCVAVVAGGRVVVIDVGSGATRNFPRFGLPPGRVEALLLTHFHSDHIDGIGELMLQRWAGGSRDTPLPVRGPEGVERIVEGFNTAYAPDFGYRVAHHGPGVIPPSGAGARAVPFAMPAEGDSHVVFDDDGLRIVAFSVTHAPVAPAVGYRIDYRGRSAVISGDTVKSDNLARFAQGVDLLVHEALAVHLVDVITAGAREAGAENMAQISLDIHDYHATPVEVAELAQAAGAKHLLYYHIVPALPLRRLEKLFVRGVAEVYDGPATVGRDGTWVQLPENGADVRLRRRG
ncbi:MAG: MBL fold metallo-hydrolase [Sinimarinibacterium flocculans]|uniref:MBL fold metallo-hydrolase n=1 Tax=Sinimarinibacterium flocculans TaxID=985250 RepID=UPI003C401910